MTDLEQNEPSSHEIDFHDDSTTLSTLEIIPLRAGVRGDETAIRSFILQVEEWASQLSSPQTCDAARLRHIARSIAILEGKLALHRALRDDCVSKRDLSSVALLDSVMKSDSALLLALHREHRVECSRGVRSVRVTSVAVGVRGQMSIVAGELRG